MLNANACTVEKLENGEKLSEHKEQSKGITLRMGLLYMQDIAQGRLGSSHSESGGDKLHKKKDC